MKSIIAPKSWLPISLLLLVVSSNQAQPLKEHQEREQRQMKGSAAEADVKMNMTPALQLTGMTGMTGLSGMLPMANMQMARYPNYQNMLAGGSPFLGMPGQLGPQMNIANTYPSDPNMGLGMGMGLGLPSAGLGLGLGGYPGSTPNPSFMYGNPQALYPNAQLGQGFAGQPPLDNFGALNNIINLANMQGLQGAPNVGGLYGQPGRALNMPGYFGAGLDNHMGMHNYAPAF